MIITCTFMFWCVAVTFVVVKYLKSLLHSARRSWGINQAHPFGLAGFLIAPVPAPFMVFDR